MSRTVTPLPSAPRPGASPRWLAQAPHRMMFFVGSANVLLAMLWWTCWLIDARWHLGHLPASNLLPGWVHAIVMQYQLLPPFMFGFLMTTFPRWMGLPELGRWHYLPVGLGLLGGQLAVVGGMLLGQAAMVHIGVVMSLVGWTYGLSQLLRVLLAERRAGKGPTWHAWSGFAAMALGFIGLACALAFLLAGDPRWMFVAIKLGTFGLLLPVYLTVAHRMFPFFAGNVVMGYQPWRPLWLLAAFWPLLLAHLVLELFHVYAWLWVVDLPLFALAVLMNWKLWPRQPMPGLLAVLFIGLAWLPLTFALYAGQSLAYAATGVYVLARAPAHALFVGFFGSVLVAMVTRVTQGHSGQALTMPKAAWWAFAMLQVVAVARIVAELADDPMGWMAFAAIGWLLAFAPWVLRIGRIYLSPRADGKPG